VKGKWNASRLMVVLVQTKTWHNLIKWSYHLPGLGHIHPSPSESVVGNLYTLCPLSLSRTCTQPVTNTTLLPLTLKLEAVHLKHWYKPARPQHSVITWKIIIWIFAATKTSNLKGMPWISDRDVNTVSSPFSCCTLLCY